ncbi:MAG: zinc ribbon domain-containing protein [bacterium]|nr:zinc ribbon domain-containing protein [bacterium]
MDAIDSVLTFFSSPFADLLIKGALIYLGLLWFGMVVWSARDIINRSNNILLQVLVILVNMALPVFGLLLYLIVRPSKTLLEKYYEELELNFLSEQAHEEEHCPRCEKHLSADFLYCPACEEKVKSACDSCKKVYLSQYLVCPYCGKKDKPRGLSSDKRKAKKVVEKATKKEHAEV